MKRRVVNLRDVAKYAGLSLGTVSMVLNNQPGISDESRKIVMDAVERLGYVPNVLGKALNRKKSGIVGVLIPVATNYTFDTIVKGIHNVLEGQGRKAFVSYSQNRESVEAQILTLFSQLYVDGVILASAPMVKGGNADLIKHMVSHQIPVVQIERWSNTLGGDFVGSANQQAARRCAEKMLAQRYKKIAFITSDPDSSADSERFMGYLQALQGAGLSYQPEWTLKLKQMDPPIARETIRQFFNAPGAPRAALWSADYFSELATALTDLKLVNGRDVEVILFDPPPFVPLQKQQFQAVFQDGFSIGLQAATLLTEAVASQGEAAPTETVMRRTEVRIPCKMGVVSGVDAEEIKE